MCRQIILVVFSLSCPYLCSSQNLPNNYLQRCNEKLVEVIMEDLFTPVVASRVNVYPNIAAYEVLSLANSELISLSGPIKHLPQITKPNDEINYSMAAEFAFTTVAKKLVFSEYMIEEFEAQELKRWNDIIPDVMLQNNSMAYGMKVGKEIINWLVQDNYTQIKTMERYVLSEKFGAWRPTAPEYASAIEPHWNLMRTLITDSAAQIKPLPNVPYSEDKKSQFYKIGNAVYKTSLTLDTLQKTIALFWDDNPNISYSKGHLTYFVHKVSPGGHWVKIAGQACRNLDLDEIKTAEVYTFLTIGLYEAFISCWSEKYRSEAIRPETYINRLIDPKWLPFIQTPPFPEYTSGHSVISRTAATILTQIIPQPYAYVDSSEMYINIPPRSFASFTEASLEAGISRFYGGIHFMPAIDNGAKQGEVLGNFILKMLKK